MILNIIFGVILYIVGYFIINAALKKRVKKVTEHAEHVLQSKIFEPDPEADSPEHYVENSMIQTLLEAYVNANHSLRPACLMSLASDTMYHTTDLFLKDMTRLGIRREIDYWLQSGVAAYDGFVSPDGFWRDDGSMKDGKNRWTAAGIIGEWTERYVDVTTDEVLYTKHYKSGACVNLQLIRVNERRPDEDIHCAGCGKPIDIRGELFVCPGCGKTYKADSYNWMLDDVYIHEQKHTFSTKKRETLAIILNWTFVAAGVLSVFHPVLRVLATLYTLAAAVYYSVLEDRFYKTFKTEVQGLEDIKAIDPMFSVSHFEKRGKYLFLLFQSAVNGNISRIKSFVPPELYQWLRQTRQPSGGVVLDFQPMEQAKSSAVIHQNGMYHIPFEAQYEIIYMDQDRCVRTINRWFKYSFCRGENTREQIRMNAEAAVCQASGCGRSVNLTATGKCKYCGTEYDLAQLDWIIGWADENMFID